MGLLSFFPSRTLVRYITSTLQWCMKLTFCITIIISTDIVILSPAVAWVQCSPPFLSPRFLHWSPFWLNKICLLVVALKSGYWTCWSYMFEKVCFLLLCLINMFAGYEILRFLTFSFCDLKKCPPLLWRSWGQSDVFPQIGNFSCWLECSQDPLPLKSSYFTMI